MGKYLRIRKHKPSALQGRIDFSHVAALSFKGEHSLERIALQTTIGALALLACLYLYFVSASVMHVMERREALATINDIRGSIGGLEQQYYKLSQSLSPNSGASLGLAPAQDTDYVYRPGTVGAATIASNEI